MIFLTCMLQPIVDSVWLLKSKNELIYPVVGIENEWMIVKEARRYWCYPDATIAYSAVPRFHSPLLDILCEPILKVLKN